MVMRVRLCFPCRQLGLFGFLALNVSLLGCEKDRERGASPATSSGGADDVSGAEEDAISIHPGNDAWLSSEENALGLQGSFYTFASSDSSIELSTDAGKLCLRGQTAQVLDGDYGTYWGAGAGFDLCATGADDAPPETKYTLGSCPFGTRLDEITGVGMTLSGELQSEVRITFKEADDSDGPYVSASETGPVVALFKEAKLAYDPDAPLLNPSNLESIHFKITTKASGPTPFDFCIEDLQILLGEAWESGGGFDLPAWVAESGPGRQLELVGVNLAGAEFGSEQLPGIHNQDYTYPEAASLDYYRDAGMNVVRLPFLWERLQPTLGEALDDEELGRLTVLVDAARERGMTLVLDPHNYARYAGRLLGEELSASEFADFWGRLAGEFADEEHLVLALMNEPHNLLTEDWIEGANAALSAIRAAGAEQLVLVPGNHWTGAHSWLTARDSAGMTNAEAFADVVDPADHLAVEVHQYFDADSSGTGTECTSGSIFSERVADFTLWARENGHRAFLGEFGVPVTETCLLALDDLMSTLGKNDDVWLGAAYWAGGPWWGSYPLSIEPHEGQDRPQMSVMKRHL